MTNRNIVWDVMRWVVAAAMIPVVVGCDSNAKQAPPPPPKVSVIEVRPQPVTVYDEYVGQTLAPATIEIRSQATGLLERQAFVDGTHVNKGDLLYVIDQRPFQAQLEQALASLAQAEANLLNAQQTLARNANLIAQKAVSQQDYDNAVAQGHASAALVDAQKALVRNAELNLEYTTLRAPRDGFISSSQVKPGSMITTQQTLLTTLYSSDPMWVTFTLSEYQFLELQKKLKHPPDERSGDAPPFRLRLADGTDYPLLGALDFIDSAIDQKSGTLQARISVRNPERLLRPGMFARVIVPGFESRNAIRIPQGAVQELQGLKSVYVVAASDKVESRQIAANYRVGKDWVVDSGLSPGDRVVVEGVDKLKPGIPVQPMIVASAADSNAGAVADPTSR
jgi:membrane fusion protein (multidrug efflux system)